MESKFNKGDRVWTIYGIGIVDYVHYLESIGEFSYLVQSEDGNKYGLSECDLKPYPTDLLDHKKKEFEEAMYTGKVEENDTHKPIRYEVLPGIQAWDILTPICNRFNGVMAGYIFNIGKYFLRLGMKDEVKKELMKMREYIDKAIEEVDK